MNRYYIHRKKDRFHYKIMEEPVIVLVKKNHYIQEISIKTKIIVIFNKVEDNLKKLNSCSSSILNLIKHKIMLYLVDHYSLLIITPNLVTMNTQEKIIEVTVITVIIKLKKNKNMIHLCISHHILDQIFLRIRVNVLQASSEDFHYCK